MGNMQDSRHVAGSGFFLMSMWTAQTRQRFNVRHVRVSFPEQWPDPQPQAIDAQWFKSADLVVIGTSAGSRHSQRRHRRLSPEESSVPYRACSELPEHARPRRDQVVVEVPHVAMCVADLGRNPQLPRQRDRHVEPAGQPAERS
jgi:hypothetical protein